jgi:hypothetical protein
VEIVPVKRGESRVMKNNLESKKTVKKTSVSVNEAAKNDDKELSEEELKRASGGTKVAVGWPLPRR